MVTIGLALTLRDSEWGIYVGLMCRLSFCCREDKKGRQALCLRSWESAPLLACNSMYTGVLFLQLHDSYISARKIAEAVCILNLYL